MAILKRRKTKQHLRSNNKRPILENCAVNASSDNPLKPFFWFATGRKPRATQRIARTKRRFLPATIALVIVVLVIIVLAAEFTLRMLGFGDPILYVSDPAIGYYPAPNQDVTRFGSRVSTNQFGMRSPDCSRQKPEDTFRILLIGDSTLYGGIYIDQEEIYSRLLEKHLAESFEHQKIEVLSIGVNAWGPFHKLGYIQQKGTFEADLAVVCMPIGDIYRPLYGLTELPFYSIDHPPSCAITEVLGYLAWRYRETSAEKPSKETRDEQGQRGIATYVELAQLLHHQGCKVSFEILPTRSVATGQEVPPDQMQAVQQLREALGAQGFDNFSYPVGLFAGKGMPEELYHDGAHLYHLGHRLYAEYLAEQIGPRITRHALDIDRKP